MEQINFEYWKNSILENTREWLEEIEDFSHDVTDEKVPDLYSFFEELCVLRTEMRKGGRRTQEVLSKFNESLSGFNNTLDAVKGQLEQNKTHIEENEHTSWEKKYVHWLDLFERMFRLKEKLYSHPQKRFINSYKEWKGAWDSFSEGYNITFSYLEDFLKKEGIERMVTVGTFFDPAFMVSVAVEDEEGQPANMVLEEITPGFKVGGEVVKLANVKVNKKEK